MVMIFLHSIVDNANISHCLSDVINDIFTSLHY